MSATQNRIDSITNLGTELARYRLSAGERVIIGRRQGGGVEVTDRALQGRTDSYFVDRGFRCFEQLAAFVKDYLAEAARLDCCPMSPEALRSIVADSDAETLRQLLGDGELR